MRLGLLEKLMQPNFHADAVLSLKPEHPGWTHTLPTAVILFVIDSFFKNGKPCGETLTFLTQTRAVLLAKNVIASVPLSLLFRVLLPSLFLFCIYFISIKETLTLVKVAGIPGNE